MKKTLCALAVGATILTPVMAAAADVKVYGRAHVSLDYLDDGADYNEVGLSSNSSRLGFKAEQKLENGMTVFGQIEQEINFSSGEKGDKADFATRDTFVGLKGNFGQVKVGRFDSPFKVARGPVNFFGDQVGDLRNVTRVGEQKFDERNDNTIEYKSPKFGGGFQAAAALSLHPGTKVDKVDGEGKEDTKAYDVALTYKEGPIDVAVAYENYEESAANSKFERDAIRLAGAYKLTDALNVGAFFQMAEIDQASDLDSKVYGIAADYKLTPKTTLRGQFFERDVDAAESNSTLVALGVEHRLDKVVRVYANLATVLNDEKVALTPWQQARSNNVAGAPGENATGLSLGFRYDF
ncbi:porin [Acinetobacter pseudolwoffii]|uniref:porin n=1 Tax=Acinetobacter pseudolwoffii TaxID=2053287 RepID=UPI002468CE00|nr:porin [Acinetobacter pseudolwoffii]MDH5819251.1 porin [Acinetobacter pseudolwoffii]MDM1323386.1 porin [Acinetobacter pseudolwoffii]